ncbi:MAG: lamin tail domain-containing protein, partial [Putridiphycobacter sp.]|nr:lamin tail domain-containing protein [Putridiphycobacter sp.]
MKNLLSLIALLASSLFVNAQCNDLFFSEYIEGSSNNKALEIYNPTAATVDLSDYRIHRNSNGSATSSGNTVLNGLLAPGDVYVGTNSQASIANITAQSDTTSGVVSFNGDDAVWLEKISTGDTLDIIGVLGVDPGSFWPVDTGSTVNYTLIRKIGVQTGQVDWTIGATEWDVYAQDMADSLGAHSMTPCGITCTNTTASIFESACESYTAPSGIVYTTTGTYNDTILNVAGCDSIITITLQ